MDIDKEEIEEGKTILRDCLVRLGNMGFLVVVGTSGIKDSFGNETELVIDAPDYSDEIEFLPSSGTMMSKLKVGCYG